MKEKIFPPNSLRRRVAKKIANKLGHNSYGPYSTWAYEQYDKIPLVEFKELKDNPLISIIVPAYNTPERYFEPLFNSVISQVYQNWELVIVDASNDEHASKMINEYASKDLRVRVLKYKNGGISENTNYGIKRLSEIM